MSEKIEQLNEEVINGQIKELVRDSVEETLNVLLAAEVEQLTKAAKYERSEAHRDVSGGRVGTPGGGYHWRPQQILCKSE